MMDEKILKELKEMNKTLRETKTFIIAQAQLMKQMGMEIKNLNRKLEEKHD